MTKPSRLNPKLAEQICERLAAGESLRRICRDAGYPNERLVRRWVIEDRQGFAAMYARARDIGLDTLADEVLEIADTIENGVTVTRDDAGVTKVTRGDMIAHRRLRFDARRWYLSKLAPKKYGDKLDLMHRGDSTAPIVISQTDAKL